MSRDSQAGKESRTQRNTANLESGRRQGEPSLTEKAVNNDQEEVILIPENKVGHVIGRKGTRKRDIMERSGVEALDIKDDQVRITGTEEQRTKAKTIIYDIIDVRLGTMPPFSEFFLPALFLPSILPTYMSASQPGCLFVCLSVCTYLLVRLSGCIYS